MAGMLLRRRFMSFAVSRPTLLRGFPYGFQSGRRYLPFLGLHRLRRFGLLRFQRRPPGSLRGGDPGAARLADRAGASPEPRYLFRSPSLPWLLAGPALAEFVPASRR